MKKVNRLKNHQVVLLSLSFFMCLFLVSTGFYDVVNAEGKVEIRTGADLSKIRECLTCDYILMNDLDLTHDTRDSDGLFFNGGLGWEPIGTFNQPFEGSFDGNGYKIIGLTINRDQNYVGLFGRIARTTNRDKRVEHLILENVSIQGRDYVGALAGNIEYAAVSGISISGDVQGRMYVGGITGYSYYTTINRVYSKANVMGLSTGVGGVLGRLGRSSEVKDSHVEGSIEGTLCQDSLSINCSVGGVVGRDESSSIGVFNSFFNGELVHQVAVEHWINSQKYAQPILGLSYGSSLGFNYHTVDNDYFKSGFIDEHNISNTSFFVGFDFEHIWHLDVDIHLKNSYRFNQIEVTETSIIISKLPDKVNYNRGEAIDLSGMVVLLVLSDDTTTIINDATFVGSTNQVGTHTVMIYYNQFYTSFDIEVSEPIIARVDIDVQLVDSSQKIIKVVVHSNIIEDIRMFKFNYAFDYEIHVITIDCLNECLLVSENQEVIFINDYYNNLNTLTFILYVSYEFEVDKNVTFALTDIEYSTDQDSEMIAIENQTIVLKFESNQLIHDDELPNMSDLSLAFRSLVLVVLMIGIAMVLFSYRRESWFA